MFNLFLINKVTSLTAVEECIPHSYTLMWILPNDHAGFTPVQSGCKSPLILFFTGVVLKGSARKACNRFLRCNDDFSLQYGKVAMVTAFLVRLIKSNQIKLLMSAGQTNQGKIKENEQ